MLIFVQGEIMDHQSPKSISPKDLDKWLSDNRLKPFVIDVRESIELSYASVPFINLHLPLSQFASWEKNLPNLLPSNQPVVVICHAGVRSLNFGVWLLQQELTKDVWNLKGGIDSWSTEIDPTIPRY